MHHIFLLDVSRRFPIDFLETIITARNIVEIQPLDVADLQIENLFKHRKIADERALLPAALIQLTADGFEVKLGCFLLASTISL